MACGNGAHYLPDASYGDEGRTAQCDECGLSFRFDGFTYNWKYSTGGSKSTNYAMPIWTPLDGGHYTPR